MMEKILTNYFYLIGIIIFAYSCSGDAADTSDESHTDLPVWQTTLHTEIEESDKLIFGRLANIRVTSAGELLVPDYTVNKIYVFSDDGKLQDTFSGKGSGPGELENIGASFMTSNDELVIVDWGNQRITFFGKTSNGWTHTKMVNTESARINFNSAMYSKDEGNVFVTEGLSYARDNLRDEDRKLYVKKVTFAGETLKDSLLAIRPNDALTLTGSDFFTIRVKPYGYRGRHITVQGRYLIANGNDAFRFLVYDDEMGERYTIEHNIRPIPLSDENRSWAIETVGDDFRREMRDQMPENKPVVRNFIADEQQRIWVQIGLKDDSDEADWIVMTLKGELIAKFRNPENLAISAIHNNKIYGIYQSDDELPKIQTYQITEL